MIKRISKKVTHQGIGGKEFIIDWPITETLTSNDIIIEKAYCEGNWACRNFIDRREDFDHNFKNKLYYVKIEDLGYIIAEDEIETIMEVGDKIETHIEASKNGGMELSKDFEEVNLDTDKNSSNASIKIKVSDLGIDGDITVEKILDRINDAIDNTDPNNKPGVGGAGTSLLTPVIKDKGEPKAELIIDLGNNINISSDDILKTINSAAGKTFMSGGKQ